MLWDLEATTRTMPGPGGWPYTLLQKLAALRRRGVRLPDTDFAELRTAVARAIKDAQHAYAAAVAEMRKTRRDRWRARLPSLWKEHPSVIFRFLRKEDAPWGTCPILDTDGR